MIADYYLCTFQTDEIAKTSSVVLAIKMKGMPGRIVTALGIPFKPYDKLIEDYVESEEHPEIQMTEKGLRISENTIENSRVVKQHEFDEHIFKKCRVDCDPIYCDNFETNCEVWRAFSDFIKDK